MENLHNLIINALCGIREDYNKNYKKYFTESDIVVNLANRLASCNTEGKAVHSELRPFLGNSGSRKVIIRKLWDWEYPKKSNEGAKVDLAVIEYGNHLQKAYEVKNSIQTEYWRMPLYPVEGFKVAIEVKVRVQGNTSAMKDDLKKLYAIRRANKSCLCYILILDALAIDKKNAEIMRQISEYKQKGIQTISNIDNFQAVEVKQ